MPFLFSLIFIFLYNSVSFCQKETFWGRILIGKNWKIIMMLSENTIPFHRESLSSYSRYFRTTFGEVAETKSRFQIKSAQHLYNYYLVFPHKLINSISAKTWALFYQESKNSYKEAFLIHQKLVQRKENSKQHIWAVPFHHQQSKKIPAQEHGSLEHVAIVHLEREKSIRMPWLWISHLYLPTCFPGSEPRFIW